MTLQTQLAAPVVQDQHGFFIGKCIVTGAAANFAVKQPYFFGEGTGRFEFAGLFGSDAFN